MTLAELLEKLNDFDDAYTIYAARNPEWSADSEADVFLQPEDGNITEKPKGLRYFLEVDLAKEVIEVWSKWNGRMPTIEEKCAAAIYYAENDAYLE